jgi:hypothetical protein
MASKTEPYALLSYYEKLYKAAYNRKPVINKYRDKWGMADVIDSFGAEGTKTLLDYYFKTTSDHTLLFFYKNCDHIYDMMVRREEDNAARQRLREETKRRMEEYGKS